MAVQRLVPDTISRDTIEAFEQLAVAAKSGRVIGAGLVIMLRGSRFMVDVTGAAARDPVLVRGALMSLDDCLRELVRGRTDTNTTF